MDSLPSARVVLIALDASPHSMTALETAARIAARLNAELRGMYVEDINLMRTAAFPFARAFATTGQPHPLTPATMEGSLRRQAGIARNAVEAAGARANIACSFSVTRGAVASEIMRAASLAEFVTVGRRGWSRRQLGSVVRSLISEGTTSLLMVAEGGMAEPFVLIYDGSPSSHRALLLASELDGQNGTIILTNPKASESLKQEGPKHWRVLSASSEDIDELIKSLQAATVLLPATVLDASRGAGLFENENLSLFIVK